MKNQMVDKQTIVERSAKYGNNFPFLATIWTNYFKLKYGYQLQILPEDAAIMMSLHKISRLANNPGDPDTLKDMLNYAWLGIDYDQYVELLNTPKGDENEHLVNVAHQLVQGLDIVKLKNWINRMYVEGKIDDNDLPPEDYYCYKYHRKCFYHDQSSMVTHCPIGIHAYQDCDWSLPIEIN